MFDAVFNPDLFHGRKLANNFFEGWYFKITTADGRAFALIPGIFQSNNEHRAHSFLMVVDGSQKKVATIRYAPQDFFAKKKEFWISIKGQSFSNTHMQLDITDESIRMKADLTFSSPERWPSTLWSPGSMGAYNFLPFMQCYAQVCMMKADVQGEMVVDDQTVDCTNAKLYVEKNWGKAFPHSWIWVQCSDFEHHDLSISLSIGHIPMPIGSFRGFLIGCRTKDRFYECTTMNKSRLSIDRRDYDATIVAQNKTHELSFEVSTDPSDFVLLKGPKNGEMIPLVQESLQGRVTVRIVDKRNGKIVLEDKGCITGVEFGGDARLIIDP